MCIRDRVNTVLGDSFPIIFIEGTNKKASPNRSLFIFHNTMEIPLANTLALDKMSESFSVKSANSAAGCTDPKNATLILQQATNIVAAQSMLHRVLLERISIILNNSTTIRSHPKISLPILHDVFEFVCG